MLSGYFPTFQRLLSVIVGTMVVLVPFVEGRYRLDICMCRCEKGCCIFFAIGCLYRIIARLALHPFRVTHMCPTGRFQASGWTVVNNPSIVPSLSLSLSSLKRQFFILSGFKIILSIVFLLNS